MHYIYQQMDSLYDDLMYLLLNRLTDTADIKNIGTVSVRFNRLLQSNSLWKRYLTVADQIGIFDGIDYRC